MMMMEFYFTELYGNYYFVALVRTEYDKLVYDEKQLQKSKSFKSFIFGIIVD